MFFNCIWTHKKFKVEGSPCWLFYFAWSWKQIPRCHSLCESKVPQALSGRRNMVNHWGIFPGIILGVPLLSRQHGPLKEQHKTKYNHVKNTQCQNFQSSAEKNKENHASSKRPKTWESLPAPESLDGCCSCCYICISSMRNGLKPEMESLG